jgi:phosphoserine phosphatase
MTKYKLVVFDMDGTLLRDRGIFVIAEKKGFIDELWNFIRDESMEYYKRSIEIAKLSKGFSQKEFLEIFRKVPVRKNAKEVINKLKNNNIKTAIATDSYKFLADDLKERLGIDYTFANNLIIDNDIITGELEIFNKELKEDFSSNRIYSICKSCVLEELCENLGISLEEAIAVGDSKVDIGMIKKAGLGIALMATDEVKKQADVVSDNLDIILEYI